ncbi:biopolymer transporter ExbD [uncultured Veillonella sp.]|uniref:ExbD/TolR family protein n=1 Tax=uncultured Veillonella sp. TaxID=159268 RepID=UPI0025FC6671|nr:biopolymer transporter ExbD [uncultured Veillonella sp.]MDY3973182.1 biopolymer transporter ExbD [Veillonella caviae]
MFKELGLKQKPMFMIIPMIDIIFFLLVFFMMNSLQTVAQKSLDVQLPTAQAAQTQRQVPVIISLDTAGHIVIDSKAFSADDARQLLATKAKENPSIAVILQADARAAHGQVVAIMDMVRSAGIKKFSIGATNK